MNWHYSKAMPASKLAKIGVWEDDRFIGAIIFGAGATRHLVKPYGLQPDQGCELVRVALDKHNAPVTKIVAIAIRMLKKKYKRLQLIVSFADPREGHFGKIYQAGNWIYTGTTPPDKLAIIDGRLTHPRTVSGKVKTGEIKSRKQVKYVRIPGKFRYLYPLTPKMLEKIEELSKPYPNASDDLGAARISTP